MHWIDALWLFLPRDRLFSGGWGEPQRVLDAARPFLVPDAPAPLPIAWTGALGTAKSPCAWSPADVSILKLAAEGPLPARARVIVPPSWNDTDFGLRSGVFAPLTKQGIEFWLLQGAYFGTRAPKGQKGVGLRTVEDLLAMGLCGLMELRGMVAAARAASPSVPVVLAGFSMAGQFSAQTAATLTWEIPVVAMSPSDSPVAVFIEGPMSKSVDWRALGDGGRERLTTLFSQFGVGALAPPPSKKRILLATRHDGIIPPSAFDRVAAHWRVTPRWIESGHVGGFVFNRAPLRNAILEILA